MLRRTACVALVILGTVSGCGRTKLAVESAFELNLGDNKLITVEPIKHEQKIKVTGTATGAPVNVYVYLSKNEAAADREIVAKKFTDVILQKQENTDSISLEATIPANEGTVVRVSRAGAGKPNVQIKITN
jgi:hypothetical protein